MASEFSFVTLFIRFSRILWKITDIGLLLIKFKQQQIEWHRKFVEMKCGIAINTSSRCSYLDLPTTTRTNEKAPRQEEAGI